MIYELLVVLKLETGLLCSIALAFVLLWVIQKSSVSVTVRLARAG